MFTMMNYMRLGVGAQGVGLADRSYQKSVAYARERVQGRAPGEKGRVAIIRHPDVRRMLLADALAHAGLARDLLLHGLVPRPRRARRRRRGRPRTGRRAPTCMTPIAKAWCTEAAQEATELGIQVHGGMGYVEETGVAQFYRDARIASIYEGTNGIQAIDLVGRKLLRDGGATVSAFVTDMRAVDAPLANAGEDLAVRAQRAGARARRAGAVLDLPADRREEGPRAGQCRGLRLHDADRHGDRRLAARARRAGGDSSSSPPAATRRSSRRRS